ncbi:MAG TPA: hypothetical protein VF752_10935 [Thermoleophilaceae bacterium]
MVVTVERRAAPPASRRGARESPALPGRELALAALAAVLIACVMHWPIPINLGSDVPRDLGDPLTQAWQVAWGGHALLHQPLDYFQANDFWPLKDPLAFSDALVGYAPAGMIGSGPHAAIVRYDLLFLFAYALAFLGAYLLARELGARPIPATVAGAAFAYAPWRLEQDGHLHVISSGGIPLALFLLLRGYRRANPVTVAAGWVVVTWQISLGFTLGLQLLYLICLLGAGAAVLIWRKRLPLPPRRVLAATAGGVALTAAVSAALAVPYARVLDRHPEAKRTLAQVSSLSPPLKAFAAAPPQNLIWGKATEGVRNDVRWVPEMSLFPGVAILALALTGLFWRGAPRGLRIGLGVSAVVVWLLSLGIHGGGPWPYRLLYEVLPGWQGIRVPGRLMTLTSLALALLAAFGAQRILAARRVPAAVGVGLVVLVLLEGSGLGIDERGAAIAGPAHPTVPPQPSGQIGAPAPQAHLPLDTLDSRKYLLWSTDRFPELVNGRGSFRPAEFKRLQVELASFPDARSVAVLQQLRVRTVILHPTFVRGTPWAAWRARPVSGLPLRREERGGVVLYQLLPR